MNYKVIIGANFGDEGKGLVTDYLASQCNKLPLVVRFNGGAQAGHTVVTPTNQRHVFRHFGSASFLDSPTFLSKYFIISPMQFKFDFESFSNLYKSPTVFVDPLAIVTTPYDMLINLIVEESRSINKHGSCGLGIGETVERCLNTDFLICVGDLYAKDTLIYKLQQIKNEWLPKRLEELNIHTLDNSWYKLIYSKNIFWKFIEEVEFFKQNIKLNNAKIITDWENVIFEGAQGLLLDQDSLFFPHVTRSYTGLNNILEFTKNLNINKLDIYYISRAYLTRHGAGPLPFELTSKPYKDIYDATNIHNDHQDSLRFAYLNLDLLSNAIKKDFQKIPNSITATKTLVLTCLDQINEPIKFIHNDNMHSTSLSKCITLLHEILETRNIIVSTGPNRKFCKYWF